ncbi:hypothetical protein PR202_ga18470 [Eleusine coracana subsp. coracana]|uniref:1-phosphatidylinositol-3-phosphate 5-kinase n=1 Tax=Eleusine coracana subsp. coracana TaxID=191504 RepID=A0AAV5CT95_ELECO|nr:hypothetical protein PR202_ga18470 [Eleusine coracana subsp. coracana]
MPALILLHKREEEDAVDANRNHHHVLLPKARHRRCTHHSVEGDSGDDETSTIFEGDEAAIWIPPEAADILDDDEFDDGRSWGQFPNIHREERQNAMLKAMNGQLKILAARFLASVGISLPQGEGEDERSSSWLDIVASLSWEAALLIKPDSGVGKDMDPASYIKVKCVPSGTRRQCEVIKGLVFKKNAAHKHMPTWCHNARLLLLRGILGDSDAGFSSFSSMEQEKDHLQKSVCKMMEICSPNVIMVEKTVSRDIQELLLKQGVTLVLDMKLNRLQRIARFSGSSILSFSEVLSNNPKLKQCDYFHIEKVMEEQNHTSGVGKRALPKTFIVLWKAFTSHRDARYVNSFFFFLQILLRGGNREELKKIKQVMHYTVFAAYHLVLETSFFEDQRVFLNNKNPSKGAISFSAMPRPSVIHRETSTPSNGSLPVSPEDNNASTLKLYLETHDGSVERPNDGDTATISSISPAALSSPNKEVPSELPEGAVTGCDSNQAVSSERLASSVSGSRKRFIDMFCHQNIYLPFTSSYESTNDLEEVSLRNSQEVAGSNFHISPKARVPVGSGQNVDHSVDPQKQASSETDCQSNDHSTSEKQEQAPITLENEQHHNTGYFSGDWTSDTDEGDDVLESQSILILMSSQCNTKQVLARGAVLFSEVRRLLFHMKDQFLGVANNCTAFVPIKEFSQLEEMLTKEKSEFMDLLLELYVWDRRLHQLLECLYAKIEEAGYDMETEISGFRGDQTAAVAEADIPSLENGSVEPEKLSGLGTKLVDEKPWYEEQHGTEVPCFDTSLKQFRISQPDDREKWVWNPLYESRLAYRQEVQVGFLERFELVNHYSPFHLSPLHNQSAEEVISAQFLVGPGGNVLCVSDDEISSIISRALAVSEERRQLLDAIVGSEAADIRGRERSKTMEKSDSSISETSSASSSSSWSTGGSSDSEAGSSSDDLSGNDSTLLPSSLHPEISVNGKGKYSVICVHADQFYNLRKKCCPSEIAYIASLSRCKRWDAQGGKSKAFFAKTMDDRFIVKQIKKTEFESFIEFAPGYFKHVCHSLDTGSQTCLAKILGIYQVKQIKHGKEVKIDLMVMENLLFGHNVSRIYDLKGVVFSRHVSHSNDHDTVYLDQNFVEDMRVSPIYIGGKTKHLLQRAIWNDTSFLTSINVMDYSLLVGVDKQKHEFVFGIIDYLRQYTWDKQLETWVKTSLVVPKNVSPTMIGAQRIVRCPANPALTATVSCH